MADEPIALVITVPETWVVPDPSPVNRMFCTYNCSELIAHMYVSCVPITAVS